MHRELLLTFGHSSTAKAGVAAMYNYPDLKVVAYVPGEHFRTFSAAVSPNEAKLALATQEGMIRTYWLWPQDDGHGRRSNATIVPAKITPRPSAKDYESSIIQLSEGVTTELSLR
ncbi:hypothetical protein QG37_02376 [Candidozyma auris]|nr:hypothetical protein QG37_02376 [[Candida] auris]